MKISVASVIMLLLASSVALAQKGERFDAKSSAWQILAPERASLDKLFAGYSPRPEFQSVKHPGGASTLVVYLPGVGGRHLALFGIAPDGAIAWRNYEPTPGAHTYKPRLAADDKGNVLLIWEDTEPRGVRARQFGAKGEVMWTQQVTSMPWSEKVEEQEHIGHLNALFWKEQGWVVSFSTTHRLEVHLLNIQGQKRWINGVKLSENRNGDTPISLVQNSPNSILALWYEAGFLRKPPAKSVFKAQRIDADGKILWPQPLLIGDAPDFSWSGPREIKLSLLPGGKVQADLYRGYSYDIGRRLTEYQAFISPDGQAESHDVAAAKP